MYLVRCSLLYHPAVAAAAAAAAVVDATDAEMLIIRMIGLPAREVTSRKSRGCVDYIRQRRLSMRIL